jgi:hypothetical protein
MGPPGGDGWDGLRFMSREDLQRYVIEASGLELVDPLRTTISEATLATKQPQSYYAADLDAHLAKQRRYPRVGEVILSHYPHLVVIDKRYTYASVHLTLHKTANFPVTPNDWAKPSTQLIAEIEQMQASLQLGARDSICEPSGQSAPTSHAHESESDTRAVSCSRMVR